MLPTLMLASIRPGAAFLAAPIFGMPQVPVLLRFILALAVGLATMAVTTIAIPAQGFVSLSGIVLLAHEALIGFGIGFALQMGFAAAQMAGEAIGSSMGFGLAAAVDPSTGRATPAFAQLTGILATLVFLGANGHLAFIALIVESVRLVPPGSNASLDAMALVGLGGTAMFAGAITIALPVLTGVLLIQMLMAMLARAAPALNLFAVGLPAAALGGLLLLAVAAPAMGEATLRAIMASLDLVRTIP